MKRRSFLKFLGVAAITPSILNSLETNKKEEELSIDISEMEVYLKGNKKPESIAEGSLWINSDGVNYYNGTSWVSIIDDKGNLYLGVDKS